MSYLPNNITVINGGLGYVSGQVITPGIGTGSITANTSWVNNTLTVPTSGRMELKGEQADIVINGVSLCDTLQFIQDRLNMLQPNQAVEQEWDQLRELGEQYRKLEKQLMEKQQAWDLLRKKEG